MKILAAVGGSLGSIFSMFAIAGAFVWFTRKVSVLMKMIHY